MAFLDTWLASFLVSGSISYLYYANRIFQLPLALFAIALSVAIFPSIAKLINKNDDAGAIRELGRGFWILLFLLSLAAAGGIIFSREIIWLLFERGAFTREDTLISAKVLQMYMTGLLPFGLSKLFSLWLYSRHEQLKAARIATISLIAYAAAAFAFFQPLGAAGLALATTLSGFVNFLFLVHAFGWRHFGALFDRKKSLLFALTIPGTTAIIWMVHKIVEGYLAI
jgi:putative peptidoglycan lipid II flippase